MVDRLVLAHPGLRSEPRQELHQGRRGFEFRGIGARKACAAERIWGIPCQLPDNGEMQADHLFPYALGGPTVAPNRLVLCATHNAGKAVDVHLFPWEEGEPRWLASLLGSIAAHEPAR